MALFGRPTKPSLRLWANQDLCWAGPEEVSVATRVNLTHFLTYWYPPQGNTTSTRRAARRRRRASGRQRTRHPTAIWHVGRQPHGRIDGVENLLVAIQPSHAAIAALANNLGRDLAGDLPQIGYRRIQGSRGKALRRDDARERPGREKEHFV